MDSARVLIRGAGDMASAVAHRLHRAGFLVAMTEVACPLAIRRAVCFSEAVFDLEKTVEEVTARRVDAPAGVEPCWREGVIPLLVDPDLALADVISFDALVEATMAKRKTRGIDRSRADVVIALGPGWTAPSDVHFVVETQRGHDLGRVIARGAAEPNTGIPGNIGGYTHERVIRAPCDGTLDTAAEIGDTVGAGRLVARVSSEPVAAAIPGVVRGLLRPGARVTAGLKIGDIDPRGEARFCFTISDKARAVAGGVLEALFVGGVCRPVRAR